MVFRTQKFSDDRTKVFLDDVQVEKVRKVSFEQSVNSIPVATIEVIALDGIEVAIEKCKVDFTPRTIEEAQKILDYAREVGVI